MGRFDYAFQNYDATRHVRSSVREKDMSHKHAREVAVAIKGLSIEKARDYLLAVSIKKEQLHLEDTKIKLDIKQTQELWQDVIHKKQQKNSLKF
ncbi:MAG: hypothetical protein CM1200mP11_2830 [Nitrosopumilaceae archaeon]|nr:MAG: hypothetical protein CM1200mP11_2830 [Nitrosopumilaceae archaeon]